MAEKPPRGVLDLGSPPENLDITIRAAERDDERAARLEAERLEQAHRLARDQRVFWLCAGALVITFAYSLVVISLPGATPEAKGLAERALLALVTGFLGYLVGRRA